MLRFHRFLLLFLSFSSFLPCNVWAMPGAVRGVRPDVSSTSVSQWRAQYVFGLPGVKPKRKGQLEVTSAELVFNPESGKPVVVERNRILAASASNERVELWGTAGRILRMTIPEGGGLAAAGVMHHKVGLLTVEYRDESGGYHGVVFKVAADEVEAALQSLAEIPAASSDPQAASCDASWVKPGAVLLKAPEWQQAQVPAAYRALVYEHLADRLQHGSARTIVVRDGERTPLQGCPETTIQIAVSHFKQGNQVQRAMSGPVGMFMGTTQMEFDASITNAAGKVLRREQVKASVRGDNESLTVADSVAKKLVKHYYRELKHTN
ncbi:MAG: hypothetical protein P4M01_08605 [Acidobacteriota bacterium]|nr:hypothetical protein [Acidobacteriota bacterium]